jgi:hygromycin-B 7''-O-kinase
MSALHALPAHQVAALRPVALCGGDWAAWLARQRLACLERQQRTGLPPHLLAQVDGFVQGPVPLPAPNACVLLTGEYTPMNLLISPHAPGRLSGMFDFGDGLLGAPMMDWLGPLAFLAAGDGARVQALLEGYGPAAFERAIANLDGPGSGSPDGGWRLPALRLLLLHRYSNLRAQLALPGWQDSDTFEALASRLWPGA